jgi:hypothetical protein
VGGASLGVGAINAGFTNHFNLKRGKCFLSINDIRTAEGTNVMSRVVLDAFEGKEYGRMVYFNRFRNCFSARRCILPPQ